MIKVLPSSNPEKEENLVNYVREMIMISWGAFYSNISSNLDDYKDDKKCLKEYNEYIEVLKEKQNSKI